MGYCDQHPSPEQDGEVEGKPLGRGRGSCPGLNPIAQPWFSQNCPLQKCDFKCWQTFSIVRARRWDVVRDFLLFIKKQHQVRADVDILQDLEIQQKIRSVGPSCPLKDI